MTYLSDLISAIQLNIKYDRVRFANDKAKLITQRHKNLCRSFLFAILIDELFRHIFFITGNGRLMEEQNVFQMK